jgi:hypothetical protein
MSGLSAEARESVPSNKLRVETHPRIHEERVDEVLLEQAQMTWPWVRHVSWCGIRFRGDEVHADEQRVTCSNCKIAKAAAMPFQAVAS